MSLLCPNEGIAMRYYLILTIWFLFLPLPAQAVQKAVRFDRLTMEDGIPHPVVYDILQDRQGFMWFATEDGAARYDGYTFATFHSIPGDPGSVSPGAAYTIFEDRAGNIWIGIRNGGLNKYDPTTGTFTRFIHYPANPDSLSHDTFSYDSIYEDSDGMLWLGTANGLNRFEPVWQTFKRYFHDTDSPDSVAKGVILTIQPDPVDDRVLWIGTNGGGLNRFDPVRQRFVSYQNSKHPHSIGGNVVHPLYRDRGGTLWIGTWGGGVSRIDPLNQKTRLYDENSGLSHPAVLSLCEDRGGAIWIGTWGGGLNRFDPGTGTFEHFRQDPEDAGSLGNDVVGAVFEDSKGALWVGTWGGGLNRFDRETGGFTRYVYQPGDPSSLSDNAVRDIAEDAEGNLWIATTGGGANRFDPKRETFTRYRHDPDNPDTISTDNVWAVLKDSSETLWFATSSGLNRFDAQAQRFVQYHHDRNDPFSISSDGVVNVFEDRQGRMWITTTFGLNRLDRRTGRFTRYFTEQGLPDNRVTSIVQDNDGYLWLGTGKGLCRFDPETKDTTTYGPADGMQGNLFYYPAALKSRTGELWFGGPDGLNAIDPNALPRNPTAPPVVLTDFLIDGKSVRPGPDSVLTRPVGYAREIVVPPGVSRLGFEFSALNFTVPLKNQYARKLDGFDEDWIHTGSDKRFARYTNLNPGEYVFRVKGSNNDGVWNDEGASVKIVVLPAWWSTWWFRTAAGAFVLLAFFLAHRWRTVAIQRQNVLLENQVKERTEKLRGSEELFRQSFENANVGVCLAGTDGRILKVNSKMCEMFESESRELEKMTVEDLAHPDDSDASRCFVRDALKGGTSRNLFEKKYVTPKKNIVWGQVCGSLIRDSEGNPLCFIFHVQDITAQKRTEERLRESERLLSGIIDFLTDATFVIDSQGKVLAWNRAIETMTGVKKEDMLGKGNYKYAIPFYKKRRPMILDLALTPSPEVELTYRQIKKDSDKITSEDYYPGFRGENVWLGVNASVLRGPRNEIIGAIESIRDVTDRKTSEERLVASNRELEQFAYAASHDLQEPLRSVVSFLQLLQSRYGDRLDEKGRFYIERSVKAGKRMQALILDLLLLSRVSTRGGSFHPTDLNLVVRNTVENLRSIVLEKNAVVNFDGLPECPVDANQIQSLFQNLILNALKYNQSGSPCVEIGCRDEGDKYRFYVKDNGIGIAPEFHERIFLVFQRLPTHGAGISGNGHGAGHMQKDRRAPRRDHVGGIRAWKRNDVLFYNRQEDRVSRQFS